MGKISFPKHISQGRRLLRNSPQLPGARQPGRAALACAAGELAEPGTSPAENLRQSPAPQGLGCSAQTCLSCHTCQSRRGKAPAEH